MELNMPAAGTPPVDRETLLGRWSWALFDGARIPDNVLVNIFVFSAYFSTVVISDPVHGQVVWSYTSAVGAILVAIGAPILGAIADAGGRRKPWLVGCIALGRALDDRPVVRHSRRWTPGLGWVMAAIVGSMLFYEYSAIFCNAMLPNIAPQEIGFWSGMGFALGNAFGVVLFLFFLFAWSWNPHPLFGLDKALHEPERAVGYAGGGMDAGVRPAAVLLHAGLGRHPAERRHDGPQGPEEPARDPDPDPPVPQCRACS